MLKISFHHDWKAYFHEVVAGKQVTVHVAVHILTFLVLLLYKLKNSLKI